jgi:hypothetical protein
MSATGQKQTCRAVGSMSVLPPTTDIDDQRTDVRLVPILLQKSFRGGERKFLEPLMRFARGDVRDHIVHPKSITDLRSGLASDPRGSV